ncbi:MAG: enoyl-CoA hydratase/isomerase family protein [Alphaproteobacteria bacterium]|nr:enoyl-CoA hydratase/isomerase family protein [Alphaproteobacteria bacterium]
MSAETTPPVLAERDGSVGIIRLNRPAKFNCLSTAVMSGIAAALDGFEGDSTIRAVLVASEGKHFCTGADLDEVKGLRSDRAALTHFIATGHAALCRLEASALPVVVAVQGLCLAGGLELMLACDVAFAGADARFGDQHAQFGLIPGWGGSQRLTRTVGMRRASDLFFSANWIDAETAKAWGLVNAVTADAAPVQEALAYCRTLAERSRSGLATMKRLARQGADLPLADGLRLEQELAVDALLAGDVTEGLAAFQERRKPRFA